MAWIQKEFALPAYSRGFHIVTHEISKMISEMQQFEVGIAHIFIHHTSASLCINENADPDVRVDLESHFNKFVPEHAPYYQHVLEGSDDMPAHIKAVMLGSSVTIPVKNGRFHLGTWQGIYLCEHRNHGGRRKITVTINGE